MSSEGQNELTNNLVRVVSNLTEKRDGISLQLGFNGDYSLYPIRIFAMIVLSLNLNYKNYFYLLN